MGMPTPFYTLQVISVHLLLGLADNHISFTLQMRRLDFKRLPNLVTVTQRLLGDMGTQTRDCRPPQPS